MANSTTIQLNIKTVADISDVKHNVGEIQKAINSLKLSPELKASFDKVFSDVAKQADKAMSMKEAGFKNKGEAAAYEKTIDSINRLLIQLDSNLGKISEKDLKRSLTIDSEKLKHAQQAIHDIQQELSKRIDASGLKAVTDAADKMSKLSKSGGIQEFVDAFTKGDFEGAQAALKKLEDTANRFKDDNRKIAFTGELEKLKAAFRDLSNDEGIKLLVQKLKEAEFNLENLSTKELEKLKTIFEQLASEALPETAERMRDVGDSTVKTAKDQANLNSELDSFKSKITYFFGMNNAVHLFQRAVQAAYETVKDLDAVMTETAVVTDFSVADMWSQLPEYTQRANELGVSIHSAYESATLFYQQGLNNNEVMQISTETLKMARIAGLNAATATDRMTNALRGFNMELNQANAKNVADVYSKLAAITASNVDEISTAMTKVASLANNANMEFETTAAFLSQIIETTRESAETAGTALKTVIARFSEVKELYNQGELLGKDEEGEEINVNKVSEALRTAGINLNEFLTGAKGLDDIFIELSSKWDSLDKVHQRYIATIAAGSRQQSRFIALMSDYKRTTQLVDAANKAAGASQEQYNKTLESLDVKLTKLKNAWDSFLMGIADNETIKKLVDLLTSLVTGLNEVSNGIQGGLLGALGRLSIGFAAFELGKIVFDKLSDSVKNFIQNLKEGHLSITKIKKDVDELDSSVEKLDGHTNGTEGKEKSLVGIGLAIAGIGAALTLVGNKIEENDKKLGGILKTAGSIISVIGSSIVGISSIAKAVGFTITASIKGISLVGVESGAAMTAAWAPFIGILLAISAAVAVIGITIKNYIDNLPENKLKKFQETLDQSNTAAQEAKTVYNDLSTSIEKLTASYEELDEKIKTTRKDSDEWKELVNSINSQVLDLMTKYDVNVVRDENGILRPTNLEEKREEARQDSILKDNKVLLDSIDLLNQEIENEINSSKANIRVNTTVQDGWFMSHPATISSSSTSILAKKAALGDLLSLDEIKNNSYFNGSISEDAKFEDFVKLGRFLLAQEEKEKSYYTAISTNIIDALNLDSKQTRYASNLFTPEQIKDIYQRTADVTISEETRKKNKDLTEDELKQLERLKKTQEEANVKLQDFIKALDTSNLNDSTKKLFESRSDEFSYKELSEILDKQSEDLDEIRKGYENAKDKTTYIREYARNIWDSLDRDLKNKLDYSDTVERFSNIIETTFKEYGESFVEFDSRQLDRIDRAAEIDSKVLKNLKNNLINTFNLLGKDSANAIIKEFNTITANMSTEQLEKFSIELASIDWSTADIESLEQVLKDSGTFAGESATAFENLINKLIEVKQASNSIDITALKDAINLITGLYKDVINNKGSTYTKEQYDKFIAAGVPEEFFVYNPLSGTAVSKVDNNILLTYLDEVKKVEGTGAESIYNTYKDAFKELFSMSGGIFGPDVSTYINRIESVLSEELWDDAYKEFITTFLNLTRGKSLPNYNSYNARFSSAKTAEDYRNLILDINADKEKADKEYKEIQDLQKELQISSELNKSASQARNEVSDIETEEQYKNAVENALRRTIPFGEAFDQIRGEMYGLEGMFGQIDEEGNRVDLAALQDYLQLVEIAENTQKKGIDVKDLMRLARDKISSGEYDYWAYAMQSAFTDLSANSGANNIISKYGELVGAIFEANDKLKQVTKGSDEYYKGLHTISDSLAEYFGISEEFASDISIITDDVLDTVEEASTTGNVKLLDNLGYIFFDPIKKKIKSGVNNFDQEVGPTLDSLKQQIFDNYNDYASMSEEVKNQFKDYLISLIRLMPEKTNEIKELLRAFGYEVDIYKNAVGEYSVDISDINKTLNTSVVYGSYKNPRGGNTDDSDTGSGTEPKKWINPYDELYNLNLEINGTINYRLKLEKEHNNLLREKGATLDKITGSFNQQIKALEREKKLYERQREIAKDQLKNFNTHVFTMDDGTKFTIDSAGLGDFIFDKANVILEDEEVGDKLKPIENYLFQLCNLLFEADLDEDQGKALQIIIKYLEGVYQNLAESEMKQLEVADSIRDLRQQAIDSYLSFEERVMDAYISAKEDEIDAIEKAAEGFKESNSKLISKLQKQVSDQRQDRENRKTERSIYDKESRLAYLRRDTSGVNQLEIMQLEKELEEERESYGDELVDQAIDRLKEETDIAAEQRDTQIEIMRAQLDYDIQTGALWGEVYRLIDEARNADGSFRLDSELAELLRKQEGYYAMSFVGQQEFNKNLITEYNTAMQMYSNTLAASINNWGSQIKNAIDNLNQKNNSPTPVPGAGLSTSIGTPQLGGNPKSLLWGEVDVSGYSPYLQNLYKQGQWAPESARQNINGSIYLQGIGKPTDTTAYTYGYAGGLQYYNGNNNNNNNNNNINLQDLFATAAQYWSSGTYPGPNASDLELFAYNAIRDAFLNTPGIEFLYGKDKTYSDMLKNQYLFQAWSDYFNASTSNYFKRYASGGLVPFTGPAWLDGTYSNPEMVLSPDDTRNLISLRDILREFESDSEFANSFGDTYYDIDINADIGSDYDVDQLAERIKKQITDSASYRNINTMRFIR